MRAELQQLQRSVRATRVAELEAQVQALSAELQRSRDIMQASQERSAVAVRAADERRSAADAAYSAVNRQRHACVCGALARSLSPRRRTAPQPRQLRLADKVATIRMACQQSLGLCAASLGVPMQALGGTEHVAPQEARDVLASLGDFVCRCALRDYLPGVLAICAQRSACLIPLPVHTRVLIMAAVFFESATGELLAQSTQQSEHGRAASGPAPDAVAAHSPVAANPCS